MSDIDRQYFSQFGEDKWIDEHLNLPVYAEFLDIGANDGITGSNTLWLEQRGWRGLCVDADPRCYEALLTTRKHSVHFALIGGGHGGNSAMFVMDKDTSLSRLFLPGDERNSSTKAIISTPATTIDSLCESHGLNPFLISIDVEGTEADVIAGMGNIKPPVMIVEYVTQGVNNFEKLFPAITDYQIVHTTEANLILVRRDMLGELMK